MLPVLKPGARAYFDTFAGLVPVRVDRITIREGSTEIRPSSETEVYFTVSEDHGPYRKGETLNAWSLHVVPPRALIRRKYSTHIGPYTVETSK